ncbi:MAG: hypothetical protein HIU93_12750 [Acidobacteria bacterium]|nr:hypothetical protein [Acidobacteriota bacterium]
MKKLFLRTSPLLLACGLLHAQPTPAQSSAGQPIAIIHTTAYLVPGEPAVKNATIVIENGRVAQAGQNIPIPTGARVIDAANHIVTPGLMDSGTQLGLEETGSADSTDYAESSGPLGAAFDIQYALNPNSTVLRWPGQTV